MNHQICQRCVLDTTVPDIEFDHQGICNYCHLHDRLAEAFPLDATGSKNLQNLLAEIKKTAPAGKKYDCVVGVSGGTDSSYLLHMTRQWGLRPLAVHVDNGWNTDISISNLKNMLQKLNIDLVTFVIRWEEVKNVLLAFMKAGLPWVDAPTDIAIQSTLYRVAAKHGIKFVLIGADFRAEGRQPMAWTHCDGKQLAYVTKKFGTRKLKLFPNLTMWDYFLYSAIRKVRRVNIFYYIDFNKAKAKEILQREYGWRDYGGHHHESVFTRFVIGSWLPKKFGIDKRKITYSAWVRSGHTTRGEAIEKLLQPPYAATTEAADRIYVAKKLGVSEAELTSIWNGQNASPLELPSYLGFYNTFKKPIQNFFRILTPMKPMMFFELPSFPKPKTSLQSSLAKESGVRESNHV